jgi:DGQHR domain-containing protein
MSKKKKKKRRKLDLAQRTLRRAQRQFRQRIQDVFHIAGFVVVPVRGTQLNFLGRQGEFDSVFLFENLIVIAEDTCLRSSDEIYEHVLRKDMFYEHLRKNKNAFVDYLKSTFPAVRKSMRAEFDASDVILVTLHCSKNRMEERHKQRFPQFHFLEDRNLRYFRALATTLGRSLRFELFKFFGLHAADIKVASGQPNTTFQGFVLPESPSGFPAGYKIATFYIDPETLISLSYVLRKDGWRDSARLYQRMISRRKIRSMRHYLAQDPRVFINNVIVSLPATTRLLDDDNNTVDLANIAKTEALGVQLTNEFNTIGIIDGQHRVFAYHEGNDEFEARIAPKRRKQQLLVTGVLYPTNVSEDKQREFEARLFLDINDKQTRTRPELRQAIEAVVNPFSVIAIARAVVNRLAADGPLCEVLEEDQFDVGKLKTSSIVSYGLRHIVKPEGDDTLFKLWKHPKKAAIQAAIIAASSERRIKNAPSRTALDDYLNFSTSEVNRLLIGYKRFIPKELWTFDRKKSRALTTTAINGLIFCLRRLIQENKTAPTPEAYEAGLRKANISFTPDRFKYRSSHWRDLGEKIAAKGFLS